jgi:hypothetical protein
MAIIERTYGRESKTVIDEVLISSDSHVIEPAGLWQKQLPKAFQDRAPDFGGQRPNDTPGGAQDKNKRVAEMSADGVSAEANSKPARPRRRPKIIHSQLSILHYSTSPCARPRD